MNILFLDCETTGLDENKHSIIEIACEHHINGQMVSAYNQRFINRSPILALDALKVNKTNIAALLDIGKACPEERAVFEFVDYLLSLNNKDLHVCGHNVNFDVRFIKALLTKYNIEGWESAVSYRQIDTCDRAKMLIETGIIPLEAIGAKGSGLTNIAKALKLEVEEIKLHTAVYDTNLCSRVFYKMNEVLRNYRG